MVAPCTLIIFFCFSDFYDLVIECFLKYFFWNLSTSCQNLIKMIFGEFIFIEYKVIEDMFVGEDHPMLEHLIF